MAIMEAVWASPAMEDSTPWFHELTTSFLPEGVDTHLAEPWALLPLLQHCS